jgi:hypothetical protein
MSIEYQCILRCDGIDCNVHLRKQLNSGSQSMRQQRRMIEDEGWYKINSKIFCPNCKERILQVVEENEARLAEITGVVQEQPQPAVLVEQDVNVTSTDRVVYNTMTGRME